LVDSARKEEEILFRQLPLLLIAFFTISHHIKDGYKEVEKERYISLCKVQNNPNEYVGKQFDVKATYTSGFEMGWLESADSCKPQDGRRFAIHYKFDKNYEENTSRTIMRRVAKEFERQLKEPKDVHKIRGRFKVLLSKYEKKNDRDTQYEFEMTILKIKSLGHG
jgi:hypothetical protein